MVTDANKALLPTAENGAIIPPNETRGIYAEAQKLINRAAKWGCLGVVLSGISTGTYSLEDNDVHGAVVPFAWAIALSFAVASNLISKDENQWAIDSLNETAAKLSLIPSTLMVAQPLLDGDPFTWENAAGWAFIFNGLLSPLLASSSPVSVKAVANAPLTIAGIFLCANQLQQCTWAASCLAGSVTTWGLGRMFQSSTAAENHQTQETQGHVPA